MLVACSGAVGAPGGGHSKKYVINVMFSNYDFPGIVETLTKRAREFEKKHPEYKLNVEFPYYQRLPEDVEKAALNGEAPTIASYNTSATQFAWDTMDANGKPVFTPIGKAIAGRTQILGEKVVVDDLVPAGRNYYSVAGELAAMPLSLSTLHLFANMTMLKAAGVQSVPRTWDEITAACDALAKVATSPEHCIAFANEGKLFQQALAQAGVPLTDNDNGRSGRATTVDLNSPELVGFATWWQRLYQSGYFLYTNKMEDWGGTFDAFAKQQVAFGVTSSFAINWKVDAAKQGNFELGVGPTPSSRAPYSGAWLGGEGMYLAAGLDKKTQDGALAFMNYLNSPKNGAEWHTAYGSSPVTGGVYKELQRQGYYKDHPDHLVTVEQLNAAPTTSGGSSALVGAFAGIQSSLMRAIDDIMEKGADPLARLTRADDISQELLTDYNDHCLVVGLRPTTCYTVDS
ncbi:extracellular solute-binding protein [Actinophytocola oryzae]|uniref:extracellular solute-binding protein n=1 Tax=Actinophytocola oryzae TaxID=502181 RepID=UPI00141500E7|nr:extracellular solute-binding protein [Actinophytocola oryzae]